MKFKLVLSVFFVLAMMTTLHAQKKHALIFAIGDYPDAGGWSKISSSQDVAYIKKALEGKGFPATNIKTVADANATKAGIENALKTLIATVDTSDVVVIHFSSHGEQVADNNKDESDGFDEAIVAYNASLIPADVKPGTARGALTKAQFDQLQVNYFRDDEFGAYIEQLRAKLGKNGDVVVFMDNCHSGTGTRGAAKVRGGKGALTYIGHEVADQKDKTPEVFKEKVASRGNEADLATYVVISAALASELNYETVGDDQVSMGSLTYAISKVFASLKTGTTYRSLFAKIEAVMADKVPGQHPVLEGNGLDRGVFSGKFENQAPFIVVEKINNPLEIVVAGGTFAGLSTGAKVNIHSEDVTDPSKATPLAKGTVIKTSSYRATIKLDKDTKVTQPSLLRAFLAEPVFNVAPVVVAFATVPKSRGSVAAYSQEETDQITAALKRIKLVNLVGNPDLLIKKGAGGDTISVASNGFPFTVLKTATDTAALADAIGMYAQYQFLKDVKLNDPNITIQYKFVNVKNGVPVASEVDGNFAERPYEFAVGDSVVMYFKNTSRMDLYINVLDMQPDGIVNSIYPKKALNITPANLVVKAGESWLFKDYIIEFAPPLGMELFKIFVSPEKIDLEGLATPRQQSRGGLSEIANLVQSSSSVSTRGGGVVEPKPTEGSIYNLRFRIKPKE